MNPYQTDVIGARIKVIRHSDPTMVGLEGIATDERKNIIVLESVRGEKVIPKTIGTILVDGQEADLARMRFRPEDKMKKVRRKGRL